MTRRRSDQREKRSSVKSLRRLSHAAQKLPPLIDPEALVIARHLMMVSLRPGRVIQVLAPDNQFYPATITSMTKEIFNVTYNGTNGGEHEVVRRSLYTTHWRFQAVSRQQRWLAEADRVQCLADRSVQIMN
jgi:hypothetical protein